MANLLGNRLNRIIRDIAYTKGKILSQKIGTEEAQKRLRLAAQEFKDARAAMRGAEMHLSELQATLAAESDIPEQDIRAIRHWPKVLEAPYGAVIRELVRYLQAANAPLSTDDIAAHLIEKFNMPIATTAERVETRSTIRKRLRKLVKKGAVVRYPEESVFDGHSVAYWHWVGLSDARGASLE